MKKTVFIVLLLLSPCFSFAQQGWMPVSPNPYNDTYMDFSFPNAQTGYGVAPAFAVIKTTNSGVSWNLITNLGLDVQSIYFVNAETGFVAGDFGKIFKTTNGGYNWNEWTSPYSSHYINDIIFTDLYTGYACAWDFVYKTTNQGLTWDSVGNQSGYKIYFINNDTGFVTGDYGLYTTTNGGEAWTHLDTIESFYGFIFVDAMIGYAGNYYRGSIYKTTNGGYSWNTIFIDDTLEVYNIYAVGSQIIYVGTNKGIILKSTNGGSTWEYQDLYIKNSDKKIAGIHFINANTGFCSGGFNDPFFYYTTTGGTVGISTIGSEIPSSFTLHQNYPNPFNPETKIRFEIPGHLRRHNVTLSIYNSLGQEVAVLVNNELQPGSYEYLFDASSLPSGMYFYRLHSVEFTETKKMILLK